MDVRHKGDLGQPRLDILCGVQITGVQITGYRPLQSATLVLAAPVLVRRLNGKQEGPRRV